MPEREAVRLPSGVSVPRRDFLLACRQLHRRLIEAGHSDAATDVARLARKAFAGEAVNPAESIESELI